jgi:Protein of unknown function (DUF3040)
MSLSQHEIEILEQIEEDLRADDPDLVIALTVTRAEPDEPDRQRIWGTAEPTLTPPGGALRVSLALLLIGAALAPSTWIVFVPLLLTLVLLPWLPGIAKHVVGWVQRRGD